LIGAAMTAQQRAEIQECFEMLDRDGSGALDVREIIHAFGALGFTISKDAIEELMMEADPDGSGELEFDEVRVASQHHVLPSCGRGLPHRFHRITTTHMFPTFTPALLGARKPAIQYWPNSTNCVAHARSHGPAVSLPDGSSAIPAR
jgi:hypothetical protein